MAYIIFCWNLMFVNLLKLRNGGITATLRYEKLHSVTEFCKEHVVSGLFHLAYCILYFVFFKFGIKKVKLYVMKNAYVLDIDVMKFRDT